MKKCLVILAVVTFLTAMGAWAGDNTSNTVTLLVNPDAVATINGGATDEAYVGDLVTVFQLDVANFGTCTAPNPLFAWTASPGVTLSASDIPNPTVNIVGSVAGTYTLQCVVTNDAGLLSSNTVTLTLYDIPTVMLTSVPAANPVAPVDGTAETNNGLPTVFTATGAGGWGVAPVLTIVIEKWDGVAWIAVPADAEHVIDNSVPGIVTLAIDPTIVVDAGDYRATINDGSLVPIP